MTSGHKTFVGNLKGKDRMEDTGVEGKTILKRIFKGRV